MTTFEAITKYLQSNHFTIHNAGHAFIQIQRNNREDSSHWAHIEDNKITIGPIHSAHTMFSTTIELADPNCFDKLINYIHTVNP